MCWSWYCSVKWLLIRLSTDFKVAVIGFVALSVWNMQLGNGKFYASRTLLPFDVLCDQLYRMALCSPTSAKWDALQCPALTLPTWTPIVLQQKMCESVLNTVETGLWQQTSVWRAVLFAIEWQTSMAKTPFSFLLWLLWSLEMKRTLATILGTCSFKCLHSLAWDFKPYCKHDFFVCVAKNVSWAVS